jgi:hypothetical protein
MRFGAGRCRPRIGRRWREGRSIGSLRQGALCLAGARRFVSDYRRVPIEAIGYLAQRLELTPVLFLSEPARPATETAQTARNPPVMGGDDLIGVTP